MTASAKSFGSIRKRPASRWSALCRGSALAILLALAVPTAVFAAHTVDQRTAKRLNAVAEFLQEDQYDEAEKVLKGFSMTRLNAYERAVVFQMWGYLSAGREDYESAAGYFEKCLAEDAMPEESAVNMRFNIAQLYMALQRWDDALKALLQWFEAVEEPNSNAYYVLAIAYYQKSIETEDPEYKNVPVILLTAVADRVRDTKYPLDGVLRAEAEEYLEKPVDPEQLVAAVERWLK